jgi:hypothetical protein
VTTWDLVAICPSTLRRFGILADHRVDSADPDKPESD